MARKGRARGTARRRKPKAPPKPRGRRGERLHRCYQLAGKLGRIGCAIKELRTAAEHRDANAAVAPLSDIKHYGHEVAESIRKDAGVAKKLSSRGVLLFKRIWKKGLHMGKLTDAEADFLRNEIHPLWTHLRRLESTASRSCHSMPPGMVHPLAPFDPVPKDFGKR